MRVPTASSLIKAFPDLDRKDALLIRRLAKVRDDQDALAELLEKRCPETHAYRRSCYHDPINGGAGWRTTLVLHAIDRLLGTHGVEPLGPHSIRESPPYEYCNAGPYVATLVYKRDTDNLYIASWGDILEREERRYGRRWSEGS